jgi:hypothetical protein
MNKMMMKQRLPVAALVMLLATTGCVRESVTHARVAKGSETPQEVPPAAAGGMPGMPGQGGPGMGAPGMGGGEVPPPPPPDAANALKWTLPPGWTDKQEGGMRYATIKPTAPGKVEISVVVLPGPAGGELANVNRWRGQIGLAAVDDAGLAAIRKPMTTKAGPLGLYDFVSEGAVKSRMIAALLAAPNGHTWFLKMTGDAEPVAASQAEFTHLLESLHFDAAQAGANPEPAAPTPEPAPHTPETAP